MCKDLYAGFMNQTEDEDKKDFFKAEFEESGLIWICPNTTQIEILNEH